MPPIARHRLLVVPLLALFALALAACGDSEATQRKAFMDFLQTRILDKQGLHVPQPTEEETKSFGPYAKDYAVITDFSLGMDKSISAPMQQVMQKGVIRSIDEIQTRRADLIAAMEGMRALRAALDQQVAKADAAHQALNEPAELKAVFDKAYDRTVTQPAQTFKDIFPAADNAFQAARGMADFLDQHKDQVKISGGQLQVTDPKLVAELNKLLGVLNGNGQAIMEAQRKLQAFVNGS